MRDSKRPKRPKGREPSRCTCFTMMLCCMQAYRVRECGGQLAKARPLRGSNGQRVQPLITATHTRLLSTPHLERPRAAKNLNELWRAFSRWKLDNGFPVVSILVWPSHLAGHFQSYQSHQWPRSFIRFAARRPSSSKNRLSSKKMSSKPCSRPPPTDQAKPRSEGSENCEGDGIEDSYTIP